MTFFPYRYTLLMLSISLQIACMEPVVKQFIPSLKEISLSIACTSDAFMQTFLADQDFLVNAHLSQPYHTYGQKVIQQARLEHKLADTIKLLQLTSRNQDQLLGIGFIDIETLLSRRSTFISPDQSHKAITQHHHPHKLKLSQKTSDGLWKQIAEYDEHRAEVSDGAWSPDNRMLATFSAAEKKMIIWNTRTHRPLYRLDHPHQMLYAGKSPYWRDTATLVYPGTQQDVTWHIPWLKANLNDALAMKALVQKHLSIEEKRACVKRIENDLLQKEFNRVVEREYQQQQRKLNHQ